MSKTEEFGKKTQGILGVKGLISKSSNNLEIIVLPNFGESAILILTCSLDGFTSPWGFSKKKRYAPQCLLHVKTIKF
jgi:hypothetical protein